MKRSNLSMILNMTGLILIMGAMALPVFRLPREAVMWVYACGALSLLVGRLLQRIPKSAPMKLRRLMRMEVWTALIFVAGAVFLFLPIKPGAGEGNDWIAFTLAGGLLTLYTSIMIPRQSIRSGDGDKETQD